MKANELMIGDWVYRMDFKIPVPSKIIGMEVINYDKMEYVVDVFNKNGYNVQLYLNEVQPIPLTPEILEKNGFEEYDGLYRLDIAEGVFVNADFKSKEPFVSIHNTCYRAIPICKYVHQLQHALRLCGIEKEITI